MEDKHLINIAGTVCPPESDEAFNTWYDGKHIPFNMRFKGLISATRYKIVRPLGDATVKDYPQYLTTYRFQNVESFKEWDVGPELAAASDPQLLNKLRVGLVWRVQYESIGTWKNAAPLSVITLEGIQCPSEKEKKFEEWYTGKHIPAILESKGLEGVTCYKFAGALAHFGHTMPTKEYAKVLAFYHFKDVPGADAYDRSPEHAAIREGCLNMVTRMSGSVFYRAQYEPMKIWQR